MRYLKNPTHKGLFLGFVPVYLDMTDAECPAMEGRNAACDILFDIAEGAFGIFCTVMCWVDPYFEPEFPITITGTL